MICLRGNRWGTLSNELELGKNIWFGGDMYARNFGVLSVEEVNGLKSNVLKSGQVLKIPEK